MKPTLQQEIIIAEAKARRNIAIEAKAGAAKTTTCVMIANEVIKPSLYIAFNKDIAEEAKGKFPTHVTCQTIHSLAYRDVVKFPKSKLGQKLQGNLQLSDIEEFLTQLDLDDEEARFDFKLTVRELITSFCQSDSFDLNKFIFDQLENVEEVTEAEIGNYQKVCTDYWLAMTNEHSSARISHDIYMKMFQLKKPVLLFDVIYLDEAQDSNPVTLDIFLRQTHAQRIIVGDPFQAIYAWRGAVDAFSKVPKDFTRLSLSESFRYTQEIADTAKKIIGLFGKNETIIGNASIENYKESNNEVAIICRNNSTIIGYLLSAAKENKLVYTNVNLKEVFAKVYHVSALMFGDTPRYPVAELKVYTTYKELKKASEKLAELRQLINLVQLLTATDSLHNSITKIKNIITTEQYEADFIISTAHKSKGLEFDKVILDEDMFGYNDEDEEYTLKDWVDENPQEVNLIYVAATRAKFVLELPWNLKAVLLG